MNEIATNNSMLGRWIPPIAAVASIALFVNLGLWQLDRAAEKVALEDLFSSDAPHRKLLDIDVPTPFEKVEIDGRLLADSQVLIDNIVKNGRLGYYVITPLDYSRNQPLLLVNRGWLAREDLQKGLEPDVMQEPADLRGMIGNLPRVAIRGGPAFADSNGDWPLVAVYPTTEEVSAVLKRPVLPYLLLLDAADSRGFLRDWQPTQSGPMTHYGYAFQWFAMAIAVVIIAAFQLNKRRKSA